MQHVNGRMFMCIAIIAAASAIQYPLWYGKGGIERKRQLEAELQSILAANERLRNENDAIAAEIESLESGSGAVEERARMRLGMIRDDEVLVRLYPEANKPKETAQKVVPMEPGNVFVPKNSSLYIDGVPPWMEEKNKAKRN